MDFRTPHTLGERIDEKHTQIVNGAGYDHCYVLNKTESGELSLAATCIEPNSGRTMEVYTTEMASSFTLETGSEALKVPMEPLSLQEVQSALRPSVSRYAQQVPFPSAVLLPGDEYQQVTIYKFGVQE